MVQTNPNITITTEIDVPEHLKPRNQKYTILLTPIDNDASKPLLKALSGKSDLKSEKLVGTKNRFACIAGSFEHKSLAVEPLNTAIDIGFTNANIIGLNDLKRQIGIMVDESSGTMDENGN
jgi:hypothetical protein